MKESISLIDSNEFMFDVNYAFENYQDYIKFYMELVLEAELELYLLNPTIH